MHVFALLCCCCWHQASTAEFHKQRLEAENKRLEQELEEARMRIRELEELEERSKKRVREEQSEGINWALTQVSESEQKMSRVHQQLRSLQTDKAVLEEKVGLDSSSCALCSCLFFLFMSVYRCAC